MARTFASAVTGLLLAVGAVAWLLVSSFPSDSNHGYRVTLSPVSALSLTLCQQELRVKHMTNFRLDCEPAQDRP